MLIDTQATASESLFFFFKKYKFQAPFPNSDLLGQRWDLGMRIFVKIGECFQWVVWFGTTELHKVLEKPIIKYNCYWDKKTQDSPDMLV